MKFVVVVDPDLGDLIPAYLEKRRQEILQIQEWLVHSHFEEIQKTAHKIKGNASSYGFLELGEIAKQVEEDLIQGKTSGVLELVTRWKHYLDNVELKSVA